MAGCQTIGWAVATMYVFALCALPEWFWLRRFAVVLEMSVIRFKGLNSPDWAWIRQFQKGTRKKAHLDGYLKWKNATSCHTDAKCCHASAKRLDYTELRLSLHHGRLEQPVWV